MGTPVGDQAGESSTGSSVEVWWGSSGGQVQHGSSRGSSIGSSAEVQQGVQRGGSSGQGSSEGSSGWPSGGVQQVVQHRVQHWVQWGSPAGGGRSGGGPVGGGPAGGASPDRHPSENNFTVSVLFELAASRRRSGATSLLGWRWGEVGEVSYLG